MSAEPSQTTIADAWSQWQNQVVQGRFVLRRCLGWSDQGAVFLTEHKAKNLAEAAIKFVRADTPQAQPLLVRWQAAVNLSHPHLVQLFEVGRWQVEGQDYLFVVMEYGDQTLAEILRRRPLNAEEVQELLPPVLDALTFLHRRQLVHSQLKPSNFLAVGDQLKLASDTIRPAGQDHGNSSAGDVWSLGATLVEALTARARISIEQQFDESSLPAGLPATLVESVRRCLSPAPEERPSILELRAEYKLPPAAVAPPAAVSPQAPTIASRVASLTEAIPILPDEVPPLRPIQTASRVTVSFHGVPSNSPAATQAQPAPGVAPPKPAPQDAARPASGNAASQTRASRDVAPPQPANTPSQTAASSQSASSAPREVAPAQAANVAPRVAAPVQPAPSTPRVVAPPRPASSNSQEAAPSENAPKRHLLGIAAGALLLAAAVWISLRSTNDSPAPLQQAAVPAPIASPAPEKAAESKPILPAPVSPAPEQLAPPAATSAVLNEVLPTVPEQIQSDIQGRIYVTVRVLVDPAGNVLAVLMESAGPSKYFARLSDNAAREWQFVPAATDTDAARVWLLEFEYTRDGVAVRTLEQ